jgi:nanoRNase/pAp phosphatase (c-di-AMP/oligoRNAs hydrolase)
MVAPAKSLVGQLVRAVDNPSPLVILPHDNPDPDALASAAALRFVLNQMVPEKDVVIALGGIVGRAENRAMLRYLNINLVSVGEIDFSQRPQVALVDTQPGRINNSLPERYTPAIVIDHHPAYDSYSGVPFLDLRDEYGATSTILTEYLQDLHVDVESKIATALFYGINAETQDLGREATPKDVAACQFLYPYTNKRRLAKIENARVPREYFAVFRDAIEKATLYNKVVISVLEDVQYPDMVAEMADFLLRLDEAEWSMAIGHYQDSLYVSLRTTNRDVNAGEILQKVLGSKSAGGHDMIAGGRIKMTGKGVGLEKAAVRIKDRLLKAVGVDASSARSLVR